MCVCVCVCTRYIRTYICVRRLQMLVLCLVIYFGHCISMVVVVFQWCNPGLLLFDDQTLSLRCGMTLVFPAMEFPVDSPWFIT